MIKAVGAILVILAATGMGLRQAHRYHERPRELHQLITALRMLETEILYGATPLPQAFRRIADRFTGEMRLMFLALSRHITEGDGRPVSEVFRDVLHEWMPRLHLRKQDIEILIQFGETLGISDREDQIKHIALACSSLSAEEEEARDESMRLGRMWRYMGALLGIAVVILLY
ncbi:stage III sporulation protein SpoAB [Collibacillus ludicampi]|jgi:stage III sporulation protein AB|uniref:Stage III sporulation protein SpoAB n=1 Tax=Collibacillus ludicampi TaxID=2771369 RepID=A0AAV4LA53_9BACL|nr:stage III sporulation protein SpoIIIAB [Collibacillus ludicampi]GIM44563.1 stage III sporulation protein SpoAB [Collibacillus ludicampi]